MTSRSDSFEEHSINQGSSGGQQPSAGRVDTNFTGADHSHSTRRGDGHYVMPEVPPSILQNSTKSLDEAQKAISNEMYEMTANEREEALHDVHGVAGMIDEPPEFIRSRLTDLEIQLKYLVKYSTASSTEAFRIAMSQSPQYVRGMFLMFLRCEQFRVQHAADRIIRYFNLKKELFGIGKLGREITLQDFDQHDLDFLNAGFYQLLPRRDRVGRAILMKIWYHQDAYHKRENALRVLWYTKMVATIDLETQRKGVVVLGYSFDPNWSKGALLDTELFSRVGTLFTSLPVRCVGTHYCFIDAAFGAVVKVISLATDRNIRVRTRLHHGNHIAVQYKLMSFGIPVPILPVNPDGTIGLKAHYKWIKIRKAHEAFIQVSSSLGGPSTVDGENKNNNIVIVGIPSYTDVLFGRGRALQIHAGNIDLHVVLEARAAEYFEAANFDKYVVARDVVCTMKQRGVRFLRQNAHGLWLEADDEDAAKKVSHGFRNRRLKAAPMSSSDGVLPPDDSAAEEENK